MISRLSKRFPSYSLTTGRTRRLPSLSVKRSAAFICGTRHAELSQFATSNNGRSGSRLHSISVQRKRTPSEIFTTRNSGSHLLQGRQGADARVM